MVAVKLTRVHLVLSLSYPFLRLESVPSFEPESHIPSLIVTVKIPRMALRSRRYMIALK